MQLFFSRMLGRHAAVLLMLAATSVGAATLDDNVKAMQDTNAEAGAVQKNIANLQSQTQAMVEEYKRLTATVDYQDQYTQEIKDRLAAQDKELASLREQVASRQTTQQRIVPLMRSMSDALEQFVALDLPFHQEERLARTTKVKQQLSSSTLSLQDKYRALLEAFQQELEFGRGIEAWRGELKLGEETLTVEFLRLGRTAFYFQSMDGQRSGYWDRSYKQWVEVPREYNEGIKHGLRIARNQQAPQLLALPMKR
jgi:septal ring factor EnvC (AmiA/AmiB activator)